MVSEVFDEGKRRVVLCGVECCVEECGFECRYEETKGGGRGKGGLSTSTLQRFGLFRCTSGLKCGKPAADCGNDKLHCKSAAEIIGIEQLLVRLRSAARLHAVQGVELSVRQGSCREQGFRLVTV